MTGQAIARGRRLLVVLGPVALAAADTFVVAQNTTAQWAVSWAAAAALVARLRMPATVLLATLPGAYMGSAWVAAMIALYTVARLRTDRRLLAGCTLLVFLAFFLPYPITTTVSEGWDPRLFFESAVVTATVPAAVGILVATRGELARRLRELTESRAREDRLLSEHVLATERARLAREMHDVVAHQVSLISLQAGALRMSSTDPAVQDTAGTIRTLSVRTLEELRHMVGVLRAAGGGGEELTPQPRLCDLPRLLADSTYDIAAAVDEQAYTQCSETVERAAFRIVQEALTNVRKHAPGAQVRVRIQQEDHELHVEIHNGPADHAAAPLNLPSGGHGLIGLRERVHLLGGVFEARPSNDGGFLVTATLPAAAP